MLVVTQQRLIPPHSHQQTTCNALTHNVIVMLDAAENRNAIEQRCLGGIIICSGVVNVQVIPSRMS